MKTKTIEVNGVNVNCAHEVKTDPKTGHVYIHLTVKADDGPETLHVMTVGANDAALSTAYGTAQLQADLDAFRLKHSQLAESKRRAKTLADSVE